MRSLRKTFLLSTVLSAAVLLTACPSRTDIGKINADPGRYFDKETAIAGTVRDSYGVPFLGGAYELEDGTGRIWVVSRRGAPSRGSKVGAKGRVHSGFTWGPRTFGTVLEESDRRSK